MLHMRYYKDYGLAISGLVMHHKVDPLEYNREVDDALPLDGLITPNPDLRQLLEDIDKSKVKMWLFTNAHITHGQRVVKLLGVEDLFEGITFCDYRKMPLICKPYREMYEKAETEAAVRSVEDCYFVGMQIPPTEKNFLTSPADDSHLNCRHAQARGWTAVHLLEPDLPEPEERASKYQVRDLKELRSIFPQFFRTSTAKGHRPLTD
ncbi:MAG: hypothetical protein L6R39_003809 [Caloplaca ligustica]|nr:MAG: hypothetical protein L6R39_003809 [Caloplaca ligustica]